MDERRCFASPRSTARRWSSWTTRRCGRTTRSSASTCRACRRTTRSRRTARQEIVNTFYKAGASFDVASMAEFLSAYENVKDLPDRPAPALHLGPRHLRQSDQGDRDARGARSLQAARDVRQPRGSDQDRPARAPCRPGAAHRRAEHGIDGGTLEQVRRGAQRGRGSDRVCPVAQARGRGRQLPRRQPVHQRAELRAGAQHGGGRLRGSQGPRHRAQAARHRRRLPRALRRHRAGVPHGREGRSTRNWTACFRPRSRSSRSRAGSWWPQPRRRWCRSSARRCAAGSCATT